MYVAVKGGEKAIDEAHTWLHETRRGDTSVPELAALALKQARAIAMVTATPARCANLHDRGLIESGKRADLVLVTPGGQLPVIHKVWRSGERVY